MLANPIYAGRLRAGDDLVAGIHDALVDEDTWNRTQSLLSRNRNGGARVVRSTTKTLLAGIVRCGVCGGPMTTRHSKGGSKGSSARRYSYYVCKQILDHGAKACPGSRVAACDLDAFVLKQVRTIGRQPELVGRAIEAARRALAKRVPELEGELVRQRQRQARLETEKRNLLDALAEGGKGTRSVLPRLGKVEAELTEVTRQTAELEAEVSGLQGQAIEEDDIRRALASFEPAWNELTIVERARAMQLLLEEVVFDARTGEAEITFRPGGVRVLADAKGKETAS